VSDADVNETGPRADSDRTGSSEDDTLAKLFSGPGILRDAVLALGVPPDEVARAEADGVLELLALERVVTADGPLLDLAEVSEQSGVDGETIVAFWRALGFPEPRRGEQIFSASDAEMLSTVVEFIGEGALEHDLAMQMARVIGSAMERVATAEVEAIDSQLETLRAADQDPESTELAIIGAGEALTISPKVMEMVWRRHLGGAARRRIVRAAADEGETVCVGFADLVGFTAQTQALPETQLAEVVGRFETLAYDLVATHGGRVVKMIGDEVMFMTYDVPSGGALAVDLATAFRHDEALSDVRVGMASGRVLERDGDVYGAVVNLASRIVSVAYPGAVIVSGDVHDALDGDARFVFRSLRSHYLRDIGRVPLWVLRGADSGEAPYANARRAESRRAGDLDRRRHAATASLQQALEPVVGSEAPEVTDSTTTEQLEAITAAVLAADIDGDLQVDLLADIEATRRLHQLELEAQAGADRVDLEAERRVAEAEAEARRKVEEAELEAHRKVSEALAEAEETSRRVNEEANRKVAQLIAEANRKAAQAKREARRKAKRKADRQKRAKRPAARGDKADRPDKLVKPDKGVKSGKADKPPKVEK
jgi:adenylate cyclase